ncbi:MAG: hypothetical protein IVW51_04015 [Thermaceae bacterium]|nr:hypothetical protein [Thermaceae bacterium]
MEDETSLLETFRQWVAEEKTLSRMGSLLDSARKQRLEMLIRKLDEIQTLFNQPPAKNIQPDYQI